MSEGSGKTNVSVGGGGATFAVFCVLFIAKVTGYIDWPWWIVTAPLWLGFAILLGVLLIIGVGAGLLYGIAGIMDWFSGAKARKNRKRMLTERQKKLDEIKQRLDESKKVA